MFRHAISLLTLLIATCVQAVAPPPATNDPAGAPVASQSSEGGAPTPPFDLTDEARITAGKNRFGSFCAAYCHGHEGSGGKTPPFKGRADVNAEKVFKAITDGSKGVADVMPMFAAMPDEKRWELVAYILYLSRQKTD